MSGPSALDRIAAALEELVAIERAREERRRQPRPPRGERKPSAEARAKANAVLKKIGLR